MRFFVLYFALGKCCHGRVLLDQNGVAVERSEREGRVCRRGRKVVVERDRGEREDDDDLLCPASTLLLLLLKIIIMTGKKMMKEHSLKCTMEPAGL